MKTGIVLTVRLGSTRLKRKHLLPVLDKPLLSYLIRRIETEFQREIAMKAMQIIIATSNEAENRALESFSSDNVSVYYGSVRNIPYRHLQTAIAFGLDAIVSVDGDDILCSPKSMRAVYEALEQGEQYAYTKGLPFGMNSMGYAAGFLARSLEHKEETVLETGWGRIFDTGLLKEIDFSIQEPDKPLRFTLDYQQDFEFFESIIEALGEKVLTVSDDDLVQFVMDRKLYQLNESISEEYWSNFNKQVENEG